MEYNIRFVLDEELKKTTQELLKYLNTSGYYASFNKELKKLYKNRNDKMRTLGEVGNTGISPKLTPARKVESTLKIEPSKGKSICRLCINIQNYKMISPVNKSRALLWRNYLIQANTFPYFVNHLLIMTTYHQETEGTQYLIQEDSRVMRDMVMMMRIMDKGTMFFNGLIGNSQLHFHFHYTTEKLPIIKRIKESTESRTKIKTSNGTSVSLFHKDSACMNAVVFRGINLHADVYNFLKNLGEKYLYNLVMFLKGGKVVVVIYVRQKPKVGLEEDLNMGASALGGLHLVDNQEQVASISDLRDSIEKYCALTVVPLNITQLKKFLNEN